MLIIRRTDMRFVFIVCTQLTPPVAFAFELQKKHKRLGFPTLITRSIYSSWDSEA